MTWFECSLAIDGHQVEEFADLTWEEFQRSKLGAAENCSATLKGSHKLTEAALSETKDWRTKNGLSCSDVYHFSVG